MELKVNSVSHVMKERKPVRLFDAKRGGSGGDHSMTL